MRTLASRTARNGYGRRLRVACWASTPSASVSSSPRALVAQSRSSRSSPRSRLVAVLPAGFDSPVSGRGERIGASESHIPDRGARLGCHCAKKCRLAWSRPGRFRQNPTCWRAREGTAFAATRLRIAIGGSERGFSHENPLSVYSIDGEASPPRQYLLSGSTRSSPR